jgi:hypothetical protein
MKTNSQDTNSIWMGAIIGFALLLLFAAPQRAEAQWTTSGNNVSNTNTGNVGIGTTSPADLLHVRSTTNGAVVNVITDGWTNAERGLKIFTNTGGASTVRWKIGSPATGGGEPGGDVGTDFGIQRYNDAGTLLGTAFFMQRSNGNVGIGTDTPGSGYKLDVTGNLNASGTISGGNIIAKYQDVAEWVPSSEQLPAGTVVVLDSTKSNQVISSSQAYDTRVAGVISEQPGIALGERGSNKVLVATTGRVRVKVDASRTPIQIGDLLVASDTPGMAMKSEPVNIGGVQLHRPGTLIGKALEPLAKGQSEILVLLSLQ